ncbi:hypothetical protein ABJI51_05225 [Amycolatopsis sp. NEAU-NG30]|uniref:Uncharacterized protein n=1 Tax=Amycolatopsis melonis TaxID=3156488 RepID=A0ABV0L831_9PSEU
MNNLEVAASAARLGELEPLSFNETAAPVACLATAAKAVGVTAAVGLTFGAIGVGFAYTAQYVGRKYTEEQDLFLALGPGGEPMSGDDLIAVVTNGRLAA